MLQTQEENQKIPPKSFISPSAGARLSGGGCGPEKIEDWVFVLWGKSERGENFLL